MSEVKTIAVVGLGLIGGSVLKGLRGKGFKLSGIARRNETIVQALAEKIIDEGSINLDLACKADLIFVCTPINKTIETINYLSSRVKPETIITDVASLKGNILDSVNTSQTPVRFIGGHPMAGTENKGLESSFETVFEGAKWVLTPSKWSNQQDLANISSVIEKLGAKIVIADPDQHDKAVALISHTPLLLSQALFRMVENYSDKDVSKLAMILAASGFRDMTRLASANPELSKDMLIQNKANVLDIVKEFKNCLEELEKELVENEDNYEKIIEKIAFQRKQMYSFEGKNIL
ncbi:MAG: prephenate dehydrogenase/arogenate dehydrogenase family protein [bacterium]